MIEGGLQPVSRYIFLQFPMPYSNIPEPCIGLWDIITDTISFRSEDPLIQKKTVTLLYGLGPRSVLPLGDWGLAHTVVTFF